MHRRAPIAFALTNILVIQLAGTILFHHLEKWHYIDSFYYTGMIITTIGTSEPVPENSITKVLAVVFAFYAITLFLYCLGVMKPRLDNFLTNLFDKIIFWKKIG